MISNEALAVTAYYNARLLDGTHMLMTADEVAVCVRAKQEVERMAAIVIKREVDLKRG